MKVVAIGRATPVGRDHVAVVVAIGVLLQVIEGIGDKGSGKDDHPPSGHTLRLFFDYLTRGQLQALPPKRETPCDRFEVRSSQSSEFSLVQNSKSGGEHEDPVSLVDGAGKIMQLGHAEQPLLEMVLNDYQHALVNHMELLKKDVLNNWGDGLPTSDSGSHLMRGTGDVVWARQAPGARNIA